MKDLKLFVAYALFALCLIGVCIWGMTQDYKYRESPCVEEITKVVEANQDSLDWDTFTKALIWVESKGDSKAIGSKDDVGILQIRKPIIDDCNRILGYDKYTLMDRLDSLKSVEMFNIIQDHYNPQHDYHWALKLWNSKAPLSYHRKVMDKFNEIKNTTR
jgi:hypothetical protein